MINEAKTIFLIASMGDRFGVIADTLTGRLKTDNTDRDSSNNNKGAFFGPYNKFGNQFEDLTALTKDEFIAEIERPFDGDQGDRYRVIKSNIFGKTPENLAWLGTNFPNSIFIFANYNYNNNLAQFKERVASYPNFSCDLSDSDVESLIRASKANIKSFIQDNVTYDNYDTDFLSSNHDVDIVSILTDLKQNSKIQDFYVKHN